MFTIESGIPMPPRKSGSGLRKSKYPFIHMEVNESFLVPHKRKATVDAAIYDFRRKCPSRIFKARVVSNGTRCWRTA